MTIISLRGFVHKVAQVLFTHEVPQSNEKFEKSIVSKVFSKRKAFSNDIYDERSKNHREKIDIFVYFEVVV